jgi:hypothetical protein
MPAVVGQQDEAVMNRSRRDGGIREGERLALTPPFMAEPPGAHCDLARDVVVAKPPQKGLRDAFLTGAHPGVDFDPVDGAASDRVAGLEKLAQELPASVTIIDDVYEERRIGEESSASVPLCFADRRLFIPPDGFYPLRRAVFQFGVFSQIPARRLLTKKLQQPEAVHLAPREAGNELGSRADADQFVDFLKEVGGQNDLCVATAHNVPSS